MTTNLYGTTKERKTWPSRILKSDGRSVTAVISTGHRDRQGDVVKFGSWAGVIADLNAGKKPLLHWMHQREQLPLGSVDHLQELPAGDARVPSYQGQKSNGLLMQATFADTTSARDAQTLLREGHLSGEWSVHFTTTHDGQEFVSGGRDIFKVAQLLEVSLVDEGAAIGTYTIAAAAPDLMSTVAKAAAEYAEEQAYRLFMAQELEEARKPAKELAVRVAIDHMAKVLTRAAEIREVERLAGFTPGSYRELTPEQEIRRLAGTA